MAGAMVKGALGHATKELPAGRQLHQNPLLEVVVSESDIEIVGGCHPQDTNPA